MNASTKVLKYEIRNVTRGRAVLGYGIFFLMVTTALLQFTGDPQRALLSLVNLTLIVVPLMSMVMGTVFFYESREFNELVLAHPIGRRHLYRGLYLGLAVPMVLAFALGVGLPLAFAGAVRSEPTSVTLLILAGAFLTGIFVAFAYWIAVRFGEPIKGLGLALLVWLFFSVVYDAGVLLVANAFSAYPLERPLLALMMLNPVDLARVVLLLGFDVSALMGYSGAVFRDFFGELPGRLVALLALSAWLAVPYLGGLRAFKRKDL